MTGPGCALIEASGTRLADLPAAISSSRLRRFPPEALVDEAADLVRAFIRQAPIDHVRAAIERGEIALCAPL